MTSSIIPKGNESGTIHLVGSIKYATHNQATIRTKRLTLLSHKSLINSLNSLADGMVSLDGISTPSMAFKISNLSWSNIELLVIAN